VATNVPAPIFGATGFVAPDEQDVLAGRLADFNAALGPELDLGLSTPQGQLSSSEAAIIGDAYAVFTWLMNMVDPAFSDGRMQDAIGRIFDVSRLAGQATQVTATCLGLATTVIPTGALASATDGRLYVNVTRGVIGSGGTVDLTFACQDLGPVSCPAHTLTKIYQSVPGWDTIDNAAAGVPGRFAETRAAYEVRRRAAVGWQANGPLGAILGAILKVPDVLDALVLDNPVGYARRLRGVTLGGNGIYACVLGGADRDVALAILQHKAPGVGTTGSTSIVVEDLNSTYLEPRPTYVIRFQRPTLAPLFMRVAIRRADDVPTDAETRVRDTVVPIFMGTGEEPREGIGTSVLASRYYPFVEALGSWAQRLVSIYLAYGTVATFTGALAGAVLNVSAVASGVLRIGQILRDDDGVTDGVMIVGYDTGSGGIGAYLVSPAGFVASRTIRALKAGDEVILNLDQAPTLADADVKLVVE
jgi:hypothetical protein